MACLGNYILAREKFYKASKYPQESVQEWLQRLNGLIDNCAFRECRNEHLMDLFVIGLGPGYIQDKLLQRINEQPGVQLPTLFRLALAAENRYALGGITSQPQMNQMLVNDDLNELLKNLDYDSRATTDEDKEKQEAEDAEKLKLAAKESEKCCACTDCNR